MNRSMTIAASAIALLATSTAYAQGQTPTTGTGPATPLGAVRPGAPAAATPAPTTGPATPAAARPVGTTAGGAAPAPGSVMPPSFSALPVQMQTATMGKAQECAARGIEYSWKVGHLPGEANSSGGTYKSFSPGSCKAKSLKQLRASGAAVTVTPAAAVAGAPAPATR